MDGYLLLKFRQEVYGGGGADGQPSGEQPGAQVDPEALELLRRGQLVLLGLF